MEMEEAFYMKKKFISILCTILILSASLFSGALAEADLVGAWDDDYDELSLVFDGEGGVVLSDEWDSVDLIYEWDGENLTIADVDGEAYLVGLMDADGDLVFEELEGYFYRVDEAYYVPETEETGDDSELAGSAWELDGSVFNFYEGGIFIADGNVMGEYGMDGQDGEILVEGTVLSLMLDEDGLSIQAEDGEYYPFTYLGDIQTQTLEGVYDNDDAEQSLVLTEDGEFTLSDEYDLYEGDYLLDTDGNLFLMVDGDVAVGTYAANVDYFELRDIEGFFYREEAPGYTPDQGWDGYSLPGTEWELDGSVFDFGWDASIIMDGEYVGVYRWEGEQTAEMYVDEAVVTLFMDESGIHFEDEDGEIRSFTYLGGITLMNGAYDNDGEEISIVFYLDETFTLSDIYDSVDGEYELGSDGSLYLETEDYIWYGYYDISDDTFVLDDMDDYFYRVSEPYYTPEVEIIGDPEETLDGEGIAGTSWDFPDTESSMIFYEDGTGAQTSPWDSIEFEYTWDGETVEISTDWISIEGSLDADGNLVIGDDVLVRVDAATYVPGMYSGGMESELEGEWIHESGYILLSFDGKDSVSYQVTNDEDNLFGAGTYSYDGTTLTVSLMGDDDEVEEHEGYLDEEGNIVIVLWGEEGRFARGDRSQLVYPVVEIAGPAADLVGEWQNGETGDSVSFYIDGSVVYSIDGAVGFASPFEHDGEAVSFSDYTGRLDEAGNMLLDGVDHWFTRVEAADEDAA